MDSLVHDRVQFSEAAASLLHRLVDHAAKGEPRCAGTDARQDGAGDRQSVGATRADQGLAVSVQPRFARDKPRIFDSFDTVAATLDVAAPLVAETELNVAAINEKLDRGHLDATTLMEELMQRGIPQRTAHEIVGKLVRTALDQRCRLSDLPLEQFQAAHPSLDDKIYQALGVENAIRRFVSYGSTAPAEVAQQVALWQKKVGPQ